LPYRQLRVLVLVADLGFDLVQLLVRGERQRRPCVTAVQRCPSAGLPPVRP